MVSWNPENKIYGEVKTGENIVLAVAAGVQLYPTS